MKTEFDLHYVDSERDLLHLLEEKEGTEIYQKVGENPSRWIEELAFISKCLDYPVISASIFTPPTSDPDFRPLGKNVFLYRGQDSRFRGLWIQNPSDKNYPWSQYKIGTRAMLFINKQFSKIPLEFFLPENFKKNATKVTKDKGDKRPILKQTATINDESFPVFFKGSEMSFAYFSNRPSYRLTSLASIDKRSSRLETEITLKLNEAGIKVPSVIGYYESPLEDFAFFQGITGNTIDQFLPIYRDKIIKQDSSMLAKLCALGYRKQGFCDFDDKLFDGRNLYLIDVDEVIDLYPSSTNFRKFLLDPRRTNLNAFRKFQEDLFLKELKDTLFEYKDSLTPSTKDKIKYISSFFNTLGWQAPSEKQVKHLTHFKKDYITQQSIMSMMSDTD